MGRASRAQIKSPGRVVAQPERRPERKETVKNPSNRVRRNDGKKASRKQPSKTTDNAPKIPLSSTPEIHGYPFPEETTAFDDRAAGWPPKHKREVAEELRKLADWLIAKASLDESTSKHPPCKLAPGLFGLWKRGRLDSGLMN